VRIEVGGFDPVFLGATLRFSDTLSWARYRELLANANPMPLENLDAGQRFVALGVQSALSHEVRHFHDFLLSPYQARIFSYRLKAALNVKELLLILLRTGGNCLPVPLTRWSRLSVSERTSYLASLPASPSGAAWTPPEIPPFVELTQDAATRLSQDRKSWVRGNGENLLSVAVFQFGRGRELATNASGPLQPWHPFELSGILVQAQDVVNAYGAGAADEFLAGLGVEGSNTYSLLLEWARAFSRAAGVPDMTVASAAAVWSLLGSYRRDKRDACPGTRLSKLRRLELGEKEVAALYSDPLATLDSWSKKLGLSKIVDGFDEKKAIYNRLVALLESITTLPGRHGDEELEAILMGVRSLALASEHMSQAFLADPLGYISPSRYLEEYKRYVNPIVRYLFNGSLALELSGTHDLDDHVLWDMRKGGKVLAKSMVAKIDLSPKKYLSSADLDALAARISVCDLVLAEAVPRRTTFDVRRAASVLAEELGWQAIEIVV